MRPLVFRVLTALWVGFVFTAGASPVEAQTWTQGDVIYRDQGFDGEACVPDFAVGLYVVMWTDPGGSVRDSDYQSDWECTSTSVRADIPAQTFDVTVGAESAIFVIDPWTGNPIWIDGNYSYYELPSAGPQAVHIKMRAFIPHEYLSVPGDVITLGYDAVDIGDNRSFDPDGSYRIHTGFSLWNSATTHQTFLNAPDHQSGVSIEFEAESSLTAYPDPWFDWTGDAPTGGTLRWEAWDWDPGVPYMTRWGQNFLNESGCTIPERLGPSPSDPLTSRVRLSCYYRGWQAFVYSPAPPIEWGFELVVTFGRGEANVAVSGCATTFPAMEFYAGAGSTSVSSELPLLQRWHSGNVVHLFNGCNAGPFSSSGVVR